MRSTARSNLSVLPFLVATVLSMISGSAPGQLSVLHAFTAPADGANPKTGLTSLNDVLCGTTANEGPSDAGTLFYLTPAGTGFNAFHPLAGPPDGAHPHGSAVVYDNCIYVATFGGGSNGTGAVLSDQTNGASTVLFHFDALDPVHHQCARESERPTGTSTLHCPRTCGVDDRCGSNGWRASGPASRGQRPNPHVVYGIFSARK